MRWKIFIILGFTAIYNIVQRDLKSMELLAIIFALYLAWSVGVHTMGAMLGISIGSGMMRLREAVIISGLSVIVGAAYLSGRIIDTVGNELVSFDATGMTVVLVITALLLTVTAKKELPIFTTYIVLGAAAGYAYTAGISFNYGLFRNIMIALFVSPLAGFVGGYLLYNGIKKTALSKRKSIREREKFERKFAIPGIIALIIMSLSIGGNSIGVVVGMLRGIMGAGPLSVLGAAGVILGLTTWSYKIAKTVGIKITDLSPIRSFSAQISAGVVALTFIYLSIPISITQTLISATMGVGIARGRVGGEVSRNILFSWFVGLPLAILLAAGLGLII